MKLNSVRGRESMRAMGKVIFAFVLLAALIAVFIFFYLQRYMVYSPEGAALDKSSYLAAGQTETETAVTVSPVIIYDDPLPEEEVPEVSQMPELTKLDAVYVSYDDLKDIPSLKAKLTSLEYTGLVIQVKRDHGNLAWPSTIPGTAEYCEGSAEVIEFFKEQAEAGKYMAAQISCFRDDLFALDHQSEGLPIRGGALWVDSDNYYWMSPESPAALDYIVSLGKELVGYGFTELVLDNFSYPTTGTPSSIIYSSQTPKNDAISTGADTIISSLSPYGMRVSIVCGSSTCQTGGNSGAGYDMSVLTKKFDRVYVTLDAGSDIGAVVDGLVLSSGGKVYMDKWLVFITASNDTRFLDYGVAKKYE